MIGGGAIGLASAWKIAQGGGRVVVLDDAVGRGASWAAAGMLAPVTEVHHGEEALLQLNLESSRMYEQFSAELEDVSGCSVGYRRCGTLLVARDKDDNAALEDLYRFQLRLGLPVERLRSTECREVEPALAPNVRGGILVPGDHQVDNRALIAALEQACLRSGIQFLRARASSVDVKNERVSGVTATGGGSIKCDQVVLAAGVWSGGIGGIPDEVRPPLRPVKGQLLHLRKRESKSSVAAPLSGHNIRGVDVYLVVRSDGRVVIGATSEEQGFDQTVTAGGVFGLLRDAYELVPGVTELELTETVAGLRPATPDNAPVIGAAALDGLIMATGHYRNGILLTPVTGAAVAALAAGIAPPGVIEGFSPRRFEHTMAGGQVLQ
ncbi:MAG: glycine oxidase [Actinomycetota bacterium]|nr:glycine oxidase [Actinomycetota bacterium]